MKTKIEYFMSRVLPVLGLYLIVLNVLDFLSQRSLVPNILSVLGIALVLVSILYTKTSGI